MTRRSFAASVFGVAASLRPALAADPKLFYSKSFPGSKPAYAEVRLERDGQGVFRDDPADDQPVKFKLEPAEVEAIYLLSEKLGHFSHPVESGLKVANMGEKTFRVELADGRTQEVKFNYSENPDAQALLDWFERIVESEMLLIDLQRTAKFDRLGVNQILLRLEAAWDRKRLIAVAQYLPMLDRVAKNDSYLNMARERAAKLGVFFREAVAPKPASAPEQR